MYDILTAYWDFLNKFSPYLLLGFIIAGFLHGFVNDQFIQKNLLGKKIINIVKATLIGIPLPLCSCGVIPIAMSLYKKGASKSATTSFLISTPQTGVDSIMMTYAMFLPILPIFILLRPFAALTAGLLGGVLVKFFDNDDKRKVEECNHERKSFREMMEYGLIILPQDIAKPLLIGILFASIIALKAPNELFSEYINYGGIGELFSILLLSIPLYVCATASIPLAVALIGKGIISVGGALIFLMAGPVTNIATMSTIYKVLGKKLLVIYLFSVTFIAFLFGYGVNVYYPNLNTSVNWDMLMHNHIHEHTSLLASISSLLILIILLNAVLKPFQKKVKGSDLDTKINVAGMTCNHCKQSVTDTVLAIKNVNDVNIDLDSGDVFISGENIDITAIYNSIEKIGFKIIK